MIVGLVEKCYPILLFLEDWYEIIKVWCIRIVIALLIVLVHHYLTVPPRQQQENPEKKQKQKQKQSTSVLSSTLLIEITTTSTTTTTDAVVHQQQQQQQQQLPKIEQQNFVPTDEYDNKIEEVDDNAVVPFLESEKSKIISKDIEKTTELDLEQKDTKDLMTMTMLINLEETEKEENDNDKEEEEEDWKMYQKETTGTSSDDDVDDEIRIDNDTNDDKVKTIHNDDTTGTVSVINDIPVTTTTTTIIDDIKERVYRINNNKLKKKIGMKKEKETIESEKEIVVFSNQATAHHPGLQQFYYWYDTETSLYRSYTLVDKPNTTTSNRTTTLDTINIDNKICPYRNRRQGLDDTTQIIVQVYNIYGYPIIVYWIDTKGNAIYKGIIANNDVWVHTTFVNHPFTFCQLNSINNNNTIENNEINTNINVHIPIVHYIPYQPIPSFNDTTSTTTTTTTNKLAIQQFTICKPYLMDSSTGLSYTKYCSIDDELLPYPSSKYITTVSDAIQFSLSYCQRILPLPNNAMIWKTITKYLTKIVLYPSNAQYRQIRINNTIFSNTIWNVACSTSTSTSTSTTCIRGLFYAIGFIETYNGYLELGTCIGTEPLARQRVQEISSILLVIGRFQREAKQQL